MTLLYVQDVLKMSVLLEIQFWMYFQTSDNHPCLPVEKNGDEIFTCTVMVFYEVINYSFIVKYSNGIVRYCKKLLRIVNGSYCY